MYHFQKNIGDYRSATMHLSLLEHGVYNQMMDWYYLDETPLPLDNRTLFRRLSAKSETEQQAVLDVLKEMFEETDAGWVHKRIEREIAQYKAKADQARNAGKLGGRPSKKGIGSLNNRDGFKKEPDAKPTANREPLTVNPKEEEAKASVGFEDFWKTWPSGDRKQAKGKCLEVWKKARFETVAALVNAHVSSLKSSASWTKNGGEFIPAPLVYLNKRGWEGAELSEPVLERFL